MNSGSCSQNVVIMKMAFCLNKFSSSLYFHHYYLPFLYSCCAMLPGLFLKGQRPRWRLTSVETLNISLNFKTLFFSALPKVTALFEGSSNSQVSVGTVPKPDVSQTYIAVMPVSSMKCSIGKISNTKSHASPDTTTETVVTDTDILLAGVDDDENDQDPLRHLFPLLNASPPPLSPTSCMMPSPLDSSPMQGTPPLSRPPKLSAASPAMSAPSPFQPISRLSPFQPLHSTPSPSMANTTTAESHGQEGEDSLAVPQAQGYMISTVQTGKMPVTFWANSSHSETNDPVMLKVMTSLQFTLSKYVLVKSGD